MDSLCIAPESPNHSYLTTCSIESRGIVGFDQRWSIMVFHDHGWVNQFRFSDTDNVLQKKFKRQRTRWWAQNQVGRLSLARHLEWLLVLKARFCLYYCIGFEMDWSNNLAWGEGKRCGEDASTFACILAKLRLCIEAGAINHNVCRKTYEKQILESGPLSNNPVDPGAKSRMMQDDSMALVPSQHPTTIYCKCSEFLGIAGGLSNWTCLLPRSNIPWHTGYPIERRVVEGPQTWDGIDRHMLEDQWSLRMKPQRNSLTSVL